MGLNLECLILYCRRWNLNLSKKIFQRLSFACQSPINLSVSESLVFLPTILISKKLIWCIKITQTDLMYMMYWCIWCMYKMYCFETQISVFLPCFFRPCQLKSAFDMLKMSSFCCYIMQLVISENRIQWMCRE